MEPKTVYLTKREKQVFDLILEQNMTIPDIARTLGVSISTISMFVNKIYRECDIDVKKGYRRTELFRQVSNEDILIVDKPSS